MMRQTISVTMRRMAVVSAFLCVSRFLKLIGCYKNGAQMHDFHEKREKRAMKAPWLEQQKSNRKS